MQNKTNSDRKNVIFKCPYLPYINSYAQLKSQLKAGLVPNEWNVLYKNVLNVIQDSFSKNPHKSLFFAEFEVSCQTSNAHNYYKTGKESPYSPAILLNDYLTKKLQREGYKHAYIRLIHIPSSGSMWAKSINANRQRAYEIEYNDWRAQKYLYDTRQGNAIIGPSDVASPGKAPTAPSMESEYVPSKYVIMVQCCKRKDKFAAKNEKKVLVMQRKQTKCKINGNLLVTLAYILPIIALAAVAYLTGFIYSLTNPEFEIKTLFTFAAAPIIIVGLLIGWGVHSKLDNDGFL
jgi:hypothetical protein